MAALPSPLRPSHPHRLISERKIAANRRNASRSTGPRTAEGKVRVERNAVKHGFFAGLERWTPEDRLAVDETLEGLRDEFKPTDAAQDQCVSTMATTHVRLAMLLRYEGIAAHNYHLQCEREMSDRIAKTEPAEPARLKRGRTALKDAGLWRPTLPEPRTAMAILRREGSLNRTFWSAYATLTALRKPQKTREGACANAKTNPQRWPASAESAPRSDVKSVKTNPPSEGVGVRLKAAEATDRPPTSPNESAKTNPPTSRPMNRYERRRASALKRHG